MGWGDVGGRDGPYGTIWEPGRAGLALLAEENRDGPAGRESGWPCWQRTGMALLAEEGRDGRRGWDWEWEH